MALPTKLGVPKVFNGFEGVQVLSRKGDPPTTISERGVVGIPRKTFSKLFVPTYGQGIVTDWRGQP